MNVEEKLDKAFRILERKEQYDLNAYSGPVEAAQALFEEVLRILPSCYGALIGLGRCYYYKPSQYEKAVSLFISATAINPWKADPYYRAGLTLLRAAENGFGSPNEDLYGKAVGFFRKALERKYTPQYEIFESLGIANFRIGDYSEATNWFEQAATFSTQDSFLPSTYFLAAQAHERLGNYSEAVSWYERYAKYGLADKEEVELKIKNLKIFAENIRKTV